MKVERVFFLYEFTLVEMSSNLLQSGPLFLTQCVCGLVSKGNCVKKRLCSWQEMSLSKVRKELNMNGCQAVSPVSVQHNYLLVSDTLYVTSTL